MASFQDAPDRVREDAWPACKDGEQRIHAPVTWSVRRSPDSGQLPACGRLVRDAEVRCMPDEMLHLPLIQSVLEREKDTPGALLPILHAIQEGAGYIPDVAIPEIAHALNLSQAEV